MMINRQVPSRGRPHFYDPHNGILQTPNGPVTVGKLSSRQVSTLAATQRKMVHSAKINANPGNLSKPDVNQSTTMKISQPQNHFNKALPPQANFQQTRGKLTPKMQTSPHASTIYTPAMQTPPRSSTIHTPAAQTPPQSSTIYKPAASSSSNSVNTNTPAKQTPTRSVSYPIPAQTPSQYDLNYGGRNNPQVLSNMVPLPTNQLTEQPLHPMSFVRPKRQFSFPADPSKSFVSSSSAISSVSRITSPGPIDVAAAAKIEVMSTLNQRFDESRQQYNATMMQQTKLLTEKEFEEVHQNALRVATRIFQSLKVDGSSEMWLKYRKNLNESLQQEKLRFKESNKLKVELECAKKEIAKYDTINPDKKNFSPNYQPRDIQAVIGRDGFLGRGGFGRVRLAFVEALGAVAIKCVAPTGSAEDIENMEKMFAEEISLLHQASHVNVVRIEGYTKWSGAVGALMEYVPGGNLKTLVMSSGNRNLAIPPVIRLRFCADIASGITFLHHGFSGNKRMTHGDLKPENILLTADLRCKISDFGGANLGTCTNTSNLDTLKSTSNQFTPVYAAPERLRGISIRSSKAMDVYSVGMIHHSILTRDAPFAEIREMSMFVGLICAGKRPNSDAIKKFKESVHENEEDVEIIVLLQEEMVKCWHHDPYKRPSMMDVRDRLLKRLATEDVAIISQHVADIVKQTKMSLKYLSSKQFRCKSIDQFVSPGFDGEELESTNT